MLYAHGLEKKFGAAHVVNDVSFDLTRGQVLGFLGPNGAGKTTTMRMLTGCLKPDAGKITICDTDALKNPTLAQSYIGYLPEGAPLYIEMTPREYLGFIAEVRGMEKQDIPPALEKVASEVMITDILDHPIETLSKGYKRRVGLAGALVTDPQVLILDEPTDGLDPNQKHHVRRLIRKLAQEKAVIISTHILEEVDAICTDTIIINHGKIVSYATPKELLSQSELYNAVSVIIETSAHAEAISFFKTHKFTEHVRLAGKMPKWTKLIIYPKQKQYILGEVSSILHEKGWRVAGVQSEQGRLEEVFRKLTLN
ncbi:MAG: ABC transporter ATP-binding protein [Pseudomonadota bacterium]